MCTAASFLAEDHYFGRNLDLEYSYNETVVITPRNYSFKFRKIEDINSHYAIIGMAFVVDNYPLYYDACNEKGLSMAGLNYPDAEYKQFNQNKDNITPFEFIPWILSQCETVTEAVELIENINLVDINFNKDLPLSPLHWMISDKDKSIVIESEADGLKVYQNDCCVMTNAPSFDKQLFNLNNYRHLSTKTPKNTFSDNIQLDTYSRGMGGIGLPGDLSSMSRFVKVAFTLQNILTENTEEMNVYQFFHILDSVAQQKGCCEVAPNQYEYTIYSSCMNTNKGIYYYKTYFNSQINAVKLYDHDLNAQKLVIYTLNKDPVIKYQSNTN